MTPLTISFKVHGMSCEHCVNTVENAVRAVDGVDDADVDLETGTAEVVCSGDPQTVTCAILAAIEEKGYDVSLF